MDLLLATLLGGALTILGGILATLLLSRLEQERERKGHDATGRKLYRPDALTSATSLAANTLAQ
jgi:hypothetical protein